MYDFYKAKLVDLDKKVVLDINETNYQVLAQILLELSLGKRPITISLDRFYGPGNWEGQLDMQANILIGASLNDPTTLQINKDGTFMIGEPG